MHVKRGKGGAGAGDGGLAGAGHPAAAVAGRGGWRSGPCVEGQGRGWGLVRRVVLSMYRLMFLRSNPAYAAPVSVSRLPPSLGLSQRAPAPLSQQRT